ncbi:MAG: HD domain-containing protein [Bacteroidales bacterium]|nr:HD domain-containing protein [Bacteroidales bacterium]
MIEKEEINLKEKLKDKIFTIISDVSEEIGLESYLIGGFVRDIFLERQSKDIDIVVAGSGIKLAEAMAEKLGKSGKITIYRRFGTAMLQYHDLTLEFVGARKESYSSDSRKPVVENGSIKDDQDRRDFTINALAISLGKKDFGKLIDPFGGLEDLKNKILITPLEPGKTFSDDPLRMMRAIRFSAQLDFTIDEITLKAISDNKERIKIISAERISDELNKIILSNKASKGFNLLHKTGLLEIIFPELFLLSGVEEKAGMAHKDNFAHTMVVLDKICKNTDDLWLRWAAILHDIGKPKTKRYEPGHGWTFHGHEFVGSKMVPKIFERLKLPLNEKMKYVQKLVLLHLRPAALVEDIVSDSAIRRLLFDAGNDIEDLMTLAEADISSANKKKVEQFLQNFALVRNKLIEVDEKDKIRNWQPPISGEIIMETFNILPSKEVGIIKDHIKEAILDGLIENNYEQAYNLMLEKGKSLGLNAVEN